MRGAALLVVSVVLAGLLLAGPADAALRFERCGGFGFGCARLSVPLDRSGTVPGRVSLLVKHVRARRSGGVTRPPLFALAGGPGQSATESFGADALGVLYPAYARRDVIVFDQRGTGRSALLRCPRLERANLLRAGPAARACARSLGPRRAFYTSRDSADDIEAIRDQLGAKRIALFGTSYGTKLALGYAKRYPGRVERLALDSVVQIDGPDPYYLDSVEASRRALRSLCGRRCSWTADPVADLAALVDRIASGGPLRGRQVPAEQPDADRRLLGPDSGRLRPVAARRLPRRRPCRARRGCDAAAAVASPRVRGRRRAAASAAAELRGVRGHHLRGGDDAVGAHHAAGPGRAPPPGRGSRGGDPGLGLRAVRPGDCPGQRRPEPLRELAAGARRAGVRPRPAAGRAGAAGGG